MKWRRHNIIITLVLCAVLPACGGGSKILKEPIAVDMQQPLATVGDENLAVRLDWVIVKDGPGTWAKNAWWDQYQLQLSNQSGVPLTVTQVLVVDSLDATHGPISDRKQLVKASKLTAKRYKEYDVKVKPGAGTGTLVAAGTAGFFAGAVVGSALVAESIGAAFGGAAASSSAAAGAGAVVLVYGAPIFIAGGLIKGANNRRVGKEIVNRSQELPFDMAPGDTQNIDLFFPVAPSPTSVQIVYETEDGSDVVMIDTRDVLTGLHLPASHAK